MTKMTVDTTNEITPPNLLGYTTIKLHMQKERTVLVEPVDQLETLLGCFLHYVPVRMDERRKAHTVSAHSIIRA
jgi:hypothetical protein